MLDRVKYKSDCLWLVWQRKGYYSIESLQIGPAVNHSLEELFPWQGKLSGITQSKILKLLSAGVVEKETTSVGKLNYLVLTPAYGEIYSVYKTHYNNNRFSYSNFCTHVLTIWRDFLKWLSLNINHKEEHDIIYFECDV